MDRDQLNELSKSKLERLADEMGLVTHGLKKSEIVDLIVSQSGEAGPEGVPVAEAVPSMAPPPAPAPAVTVAPAAAPESADAFFKVSKASRYAVDGFCHTVPAGMIVSARTHDVALMRAQGVPLVPMGEPSTKDLHTAPGRLGQLRALTGSAPEEAMDAFGGEAQAYYQLGPDGEYLPVEPIAVAANISISATLK